MVSAQQTLYSQLSQALIQDQDIEGYQNTLNFLKSQQCVADEDILVPYLETTVQSQSQQTIRINTIELKPKDDYITLCTGAGNVPVEGFYSSEKESPSHEFTYVKMKKYIDPSIGIEANKKRGFNSLKSLLSAKNYKNVILIDNFGMSLPLVEGLKEHLQSLKSNVVIIPYSIAQLHFPHESYYYTEIHSESVEKDVKRSYYKIQNRPQTLQNIAFVAILPDKNDRAQQTYFTSVLYSYMQISKQMPGVHITLYILNTDDLKLMKNMLFRDIKNEQLLLGTVIFRNINSIFPQRKLFLEGQHIRDPRKAIYGSQYSFQVNYTENNHSQEQLIPTSDELALVIGSPNSDPMWYKYDVHTLDDLIRFVRNYIQSQITSHASDRIETNPRPGF